MNLRCIYCQTPFTLSRSEMLSGIITMNERHQNHYDAHCPRCRRANSISRQRMELFYPNWQDAAKQQAATHPPVAELKVDTPAVATAKTEPLPKAAKDTAKKAPAEKKTAARKPVEKSTKENKPAASSKVKKTADSTESKAKKPAAKTAETKTKKK